MFLSYTKKLHTNIGDNPGGKCKNEKKKKLPANLYLCNVCTESYFLLFLRRFDNIGFSVVSITWCSNANFKCHHKFVNEIQNSTWIINTAQKRKFSITEFFSKCDQICRKLRIWAHLLKKSLMKNFNFCAVKCTVINFQIWLSY